MARRRKAELSLCLSNTSRQTRPPAPYFLGVPTLVSLVLATLEFLHSLALAILFLANDDCYK